MLQGLFTPIIAGLLETVEAHRMTKSPWFTIGHYHFYFNSHMLMVLIAALLMMLIFPRMAARAKKDPVPHGTDNFFESIMAYLREDVFKPTLGVHADRFAPFLWTVFFFILFCNLIGLIPIEQIIDLINLKAHTHWPVWGGAATSDFMVTAALALVAFVWIHVSGVWQCIRMQMDPSLNPHHTGTDHLKPHGHGDMLGLVGTENGDLVSDHYVGDGHDHAHGVHSAPYGKSFPVAAVVGFFDYWKHFTPKVPWWLWPLIFVLELFGALIKPFALCVRLFANMLAGHLVLGALIGLIFVAASYYARGGVSVVVVIACVAFALLEVLVSFIQAYIFMFLTTLFIATAVAPEH